MVCLSSAPHRQQQQRKNNFCASLGDIVEQCFLLTTCPTDQSGYGEGFYGLELGKFRHSGNAQAPGHHCLRVSLASGSPLLIGHGLSAIRPHRQQQQRRGWKNTFCASLGDNMEQFPTNYLPN